MLSIYSSAGVCPSILHDLGPGNINRKGFDDKTTMKLHLPAERLLDNPGKHEPSLRQDKMVDLASQLLSNIVIFLTFFTQG